MAKRRGDLRVGETLCAFLNGDSGTVIVGVTPKGKIVGQEVTDKTRREIAAMLGRFEPPPAVEVEYMDLAGSDRKLIWFETRLQGEARSRSTGGPTSESRRRRRGCRGSATTPCSSIVCMRGSAGRISQSSASESRTSTPRRSCARVRMPCGTGASPRQRAWTSATSWTGLDCGSMAVAVFDDRIEVWSHGTLPPGVTTEALAGPHKSILRNPLIAGTFHRTGAVEVWGRGTNRVIEECRRWGVQPPSFEVVTGALRVTFPAAIGPGEQAGEIEDTLGARARKILSILKERGPMGSAALLQALGETVSQRALQGDLARLRDAGLVSSSGKGRATAYRVPEDGSRR